MRFKEAVCVVTGAGSGIGGAVARRLAGEGGSVACVDVDSDAATRTARTIVSTGGNALAYACDVSKESDVQSTFERIPADFGRPISVLFANAAVEGPIGVDVADIPAAEWDRVFAVNVRGPFLCAKYALPSMRQNGRGSIVLTGSNSSFIAFPGWTVYTATKGAALMLAKNLAVDLAPDNIRVNIVCPGTTETPMYRRGREQALGPADALRDVSLERRGSTDEIANVMLFVASEEASMMTGASVAADFGNTARGGPTWPSPHWWTV